MCRLYGYVTRAERSAADLLGEDGLAAFTSLTAVHSDGWGTAWHTADGRTHTESSPRSAAMDPRYDQLMREPLSCAGLVHLRWATGGLDVGPQNTHPFFDRQYALAHNGHIAPISGLEELLTPPSRAALHGDTDSERYFRFVRQCIDESGDEVRGVTHALARLIKHFPHSSLNALLLAPTRMFAIHINSRATSPLRALRAMFRDVRRRGRDPTPPCHGVLRHGLPGAGGEHRGGLQRT